MKWLEKNWIIVAVVVGVYLLLNTQTGNTLFAGLLGGGSTTNTVPSPAILGS